MCIRDRYPESLPPQALYSIVSKQLPGYGGSLDTAVQDLKHYASSGFGSLVLCGGRRRGEILKELLHAQQVDALLAFQMCIRDRACPSRRLF